MFKVEVNMELTSKQKEKYFCSTFLKEIGEKGQVKLLNSKVLVIGAGGLASATLMYLTSLGIGTIGVVDFDVVNLDNLPRQILYSLQDVSKLKVDVAKEKLQKLNDDVEIISYNEKLTSKNAKKIFSGYDIVLDCVDNFETKFLINDTCRELKIDLVSGGVSGFKGQVMLITKESKKDFKSLFSDTSFKISKEVRDTDRGVYPLAVSLVSTIECNEAIKHLLKLDKHIDGEVLVINSLVPSVEKFYL